jgi:hypothetical protein
MHAKRGHRPRKKDIMAKSIKKSLLPFIKAVMQESMKSAGVTVDETNSSESRIVVKGDGKYDKWLDRQTAAAKK